MDKKKKEIAKSAKKIARVKIEVSLTAYLNTLTAEFSPASKKLKKEIAKGAKKLAKELAGELTFPKPAEPVKATKENTAPAAAPAKKPTEKAPAVKPATPAKPAAAKAAAARPEKATE